MFMQQRSSNINLMSDLEKYKKENTVQERILTITNNPEIIVKLKNKTNSSPEKLKKMNSKWSKYENEQKLILSKLNEEINKKRVSIPNSLILLKPI